MLRQDLVKRSDQFGYGMKIVGCSNEITHELLCSGRPDKMGYSVENGVNNKEKFLTWQTI